MLTRFITIGALLSISAGSAIAKKAKAPPPAALSWFKVADVQASLQGTWKFNDDVVTVKGATITQTTPKGETDTYTLHVEQPGRVSFKSADGSAVNYAYAVTGKTRHLYFGRTGVKHGDLYVAGDNYGGTGVVIFDAKTKTCTSHKLFFGDWQAPEPAECSLGSQDGKTALTYAWPHPSKKTADGTPKMKTRTLFVVGDVLLEQTDSTDGNLVPATP
jgi:hypothetical protein